MRRDTRTVRVGSGAWRGRVLRYPAGAVLRPTMQRTKHSFFSSLGDRLRDTVFVDCFAGAGGVGIEALSLGAGHVHFIEMNREAVDALRANLALCSAPPSRYHVHHGRVAEVLARDPSPVRDAQIVFADPPYDLDPGAGFLVELASGRFSRLEVIVIEHRTGNDPPPPRGLRIERERRFGETTLTYLVPAQESE